MQENLFSNVFDDDDVFGCCEDSEEFSQIKKTSHRIKRIEAEKKAKKRAIWITTLGCNPGFGWYCQQKGYVKQSSSSKRQQFLKQQSNRRIRREKMSIPAKGFGCHRVFDYWLELY